MKNFSIQNNNNTFAASSPKTIFIGMTCGSYFYGYLKAIICKGIRLSIHNGLLHSCRNLSLARCGAIAFLIFNTLIFCYMPKTTKNASSVKNSSAQARQYGAKSVSIEAFNIEMNAKNKAYYFILSKGLLDSFAEFCKIYHSDDPHQDCVNYLAAQL